MCLCLRIVPLDDLKLDAVLEVADDRELELERRLHARRVPEHVMAVEVDH